METLDLNKCMNCDERRELCEISIGTDHNHGLSSGHITVCSTCYKKKSKLFWSAKANYEKFGKLICPMMPRRRFAAYPSGCSRSCSDERFEPLPGCQCVECLSKAGRHHYTTTHWHNFIPGTWRPYSWERE